MVIDVRPRTGHKVREFHSRTTLAITDTAHIRKEEGRSALVILDRDGVLCDNLEGGVLDIPHFTLVQEIVTALHHVSGSNFKVGIATNQPEVAEGKLLVANLNGMHAILNGKAIEAGIRPENFTIQVCMHGRNAGCDCRKPKTGLIRNMINHFELDPEDTNFYMVGDMLRDVQTLNQLNNEAVREGKALGSKTTILLTWIHGKSGGILDQESRKLVIPDYEVHSLDAAMRLIRNKEGWILTD